MRIGILVNKFPVISQAWAVDHAAELLRRGHEVVVLPLDSVAPSDWQPSESVLATVRATAPRPGPRRANASALEGLPIVLRAALGARKSRVRFALEREGAPRGLRNRLLLAERVERSGPFDVLHAQFAWTAPAAIGLVRRGLHVGPIVCSIHGTDANVTGREHPGWLKAISSRVACMTAGSTYMRGVVEGQGVPSEKLRIWPQGVDVSREVSHVPRRPDEFRVLTVGRLVEFKGHDDSLRVIAAARARIPGLRLTLFGDGPQRDSLVRLAAELAIDDIVTFAHGGQADVFAAHATTDAYLQMGKRAADDSIEGQGVAVCEAAASGIACVATRSGGLTDVVVDGATGRLVDERDVGAGADALVALARDDDYRRELGAAARRFMQERFSLAATTARIEDIYREATRAG